MNLASAAAAKKYMAKTLPGATSPDDFMPWTIWPTLICRPARTRKRSASSKKRRRRRRLISRCFRPHMRFAAIPARYALERRRWSAAAALRCSLTWFPWMRFRLRKRSRASHAHSAQRAAGIYRRRERRSRSWKPIENALRQVHEGYDWSAPGRSAAACRAGMGRTRGRKSRLRVARDASPQRISKTRPRSIL